ncbi:GLPGLI family protein [Kaistella faecalis]|uniref:GLPGLI family protein n=1 Tax=Kaistella faecalis TaxID=2852098 RepID=UPI001C464E5F|nr:GLPGLI family protein [Chryseobacterium faecale]UFK97861.1 GLPGLI family protein [Chryseobacterium faecale]
MRILIPLFLLFCNLSFAQNQRFSYYYSFVKDTLNTQEVTKELMNLDITKNGSAFYSHDVHVSDSTMTAYFEKQIKTTGSMNVDTRMMSQRKGTVKYRIIKEYPDFKIASVLNIGMDYYKVSDDRKLIWKILPDRQKIGDFNAQKATTEFAGRKWEAWFSSELPFQDGPYKFHGLPGLIIKLQDHTGTHQFELAGISKFTESPENFSGFGGGNKVIEINRLQYRKLYLEDRNDPAKVIKQAMANGAALKFTDQSGNVIPPAQMIKNREQNAKSKNAKDNNVIEVDLLK